MLLFTLVKAESRAMVLSISNTGITYRRKLVQKTSILILYNSLFRYLAYRIV